MMRWRSSGIWISALSVLIMGLSCGSNEFSGSRNARVGSSNAFSEGDFSLTDEKENENMDLRITQKPEPVVKIKTREPESELEPQLQELETSLPQTKFVVSDGTGGTSDVQILMAFSNHIDMRKPYSSAEDTTGGDYFKNTYAPWGSQRRDLKHKKIDDRYIYLKGDALTLRDRGIQQFTVDQDGNLEYYVCQGKDGSPSCGDGRYKRVKTDNSGRLVDYPGPDGQLITGTDSVSDFQPYYIDINSYDGRTRFHKSLLGLKNFHREMTKAGGLIQSVTKLTIASDWGGFHITPWYKSTPIITSEYLSKSASKITAVDVKRLQEGTMLTTLASDHRNFFSSKPKDFKIVMAVATNTLEMDQVASLKAKMSGSVKEHAYEFMGVVSDTSHQAVTELASTYNAEDETGLFDIYDVNHSTPVWKALMTAVKARITKYATEKVFTIADLPVVSVKYGRTTASEAETLHSYYWREDKKQGSDRKLRIKQIGLGEATHIFVTYQR